eukprot:6908385-Ditylum_brightwellii.AAC.1
MQYWEQEQFQHTLVWDPVQNVAKCCSVPGTIAYQILAAMMNIERSMEDIELVAHNTVLSTEEQEDAQALEDPITEDLATFMQSEESLHKTKQTLNTD